MQISKKQRQRTNNKKVKIILKEIISLYHFGYVSINLKQHLFFSYLPIKFLILKNEIQNIASYYKLPTLQKVFLNA